MNTKKEASNLIQLKWKLRYKRRIVIGNMPVQGNVPAEIFLPFGSASITRKTNISLETEGGEGVRIWASGIGSRVLDSDPILLYPLFRQTEKIQVPGFDEKIELEVFLINKDVDRLQSQALISRLHYLAAPLRGLFLGCRFVDHIQQRRFRDFLAKLNGQNLIDDWTGAWEEKPGKIIGCAVLTTLLHGNPTLREQLPSDGIGAALSDLKRLTKLKQVKGKLGEFIKEFGLVWGSRFAVDLPYQGIGVGTLLAKYLCTVATAYWRPRPRFIEVITTVEKQKQPMQRPIPTNDFLTRAGYVKVGPLPRSSPLYILNHETGQRDPRGATKFYYYADLAKL